MCDSRISSEDEGGSAGGDRPALPALRALVVAGDEVERHLLSRQLLSWGCRCEQVEDAPSALASMQEASHVADPFRIVVCKGNNPGCKPILLIAAPNADSEMARFHQVETIPRVLFSLAQGNFNEMVASTVDVVFPEFAHTGTTLGPPSAVRKARILVVEDNPVNQHVALAILAELGCQADLAANGAEAVKLLQQVDYDLVLMDCQMPEMDGYEATRRIRDTSGGVRNPQVPIVATTADAMPANRARCLNAGMNGYLAKPLTAKDLATVLAVWGIVGNKELRIKNEE